MAGARLDRGPRPPGGGGEKKWDGSGGQSEQALGRSRGGFGTKVHAAVSGLGLPARLLLTPGQAADSRQAESLIDGLPAAVVIADKGYDARAVVEAIVARGAEAVIPTLRNRKVQRVYDRDRYKDRNLAERFWNKVKQYRRVATRYEKTAKNDFGFRPAGLDHDPAAVAQAAETHQLLSTRPSTTVVTRPGD
jgi:transposase